VTGAVRLGLVRSPARVVGAIGDWTDGPAKGSGLSESLLSPPVSLEEIGRRCSVVVLALDETESLAALSALRGAAAPGGAIVSTSPSVSLGRMRSLVGAGPALFRAIVPPGTIPGEGAAALAAEPGTVPQTIAMVTASLAWIGTVGPMAEDALDSAAALALGGAAFLCSALEGMEDGAVREGLPRDTARAFAYQTALATALLLRDHSGSPADLKDQVASPGGTTIAALATLEDAAVRGAFLRAVQRSALKVRERREGARPGVIE